ncbi:MAG: TonB-dependent receptor [Candidatus Azobacteroides sp.]|nr:TonB-dependent receptor [Candidatus Azobacteroides sp.]
MQRTRKKTGGRILMFTLLFFCYANLFAQQKTVSGVITEFNGEPIIGASILVKGTSVGTISGMNGDFSISLPSGKNTLVVSYVGMRTKEIVVSGSTMNITLENDENSLDEVVAIGYGTVKRKDLTGTVTSIGENAIKDIPVATAAQAIKGRLAGVQVTSADGSPDAEVLIRVRGGGSITGDNSPLFIIDGFPARNINDVAPADIQSIDVLKDASATAIYGSQGANGVVIITTKSAKAGKTQISYNGYLQSKKLSKRMDVLDPYEYVLFNYERAALDGTTALNNFTTTFGLWQDLDLYKYQKGHDWQEDLFGSNVLSQQHNLSITGGNEKTKFSLSGTYNKDGGLMVNNDYSRLNLNFKLNHQIAENLTFDFNSRVADTETNGSGTSGGTYKVRTSQAITGKAVDGLEEFTTIDTSTMTDEEADQYARDHLSLTEQAQQYWRRRNNRAFNFQGAISWNIIKNLTYRLEGGYEYGFNGTKNYWGPYSSQSGNEGQNLPLVDWTKENTGTYRIANTLSYAFDLNKVHQFDVMLGHEMTDNSRSNNYIKAKYFAKEMTPEKIFANLGLSSGANNLSTSSFVNPDDRLLSFFGRFNYRFNDRYLFTFTMRADGSSKFAPGHQWGYFPAAALAWRINEESFMENTKDWLSYLKLRLSYGEVGNNRIASSLFKLDYKVGGNSGSSRQYGVGETLNSYYVVTNEQLANPNLKWETTITRNVGLDFGLFKGMIDGTFDLYKNTTKDLLLEGDIVAPGYSKQFVNVGQTSNKGFELTLNAYILDKKNYSLGASFNIGVNHSNVDKLEKGVPYKSFQSGWAGTDLRGQDDYRVMVGEAVGVMYGYVTDGYYTTDDFTGYDAANKRWLLKDGVAVNSYVTVRPGALKLKDLPDENGNYDGVINENDRTIIGRASPKNTGGFGLNGTYHGFDASVYFNWVYGNQIYNADKIAFTQQYRTTYPNVLAYMNSSNRYTYLDAQGNVVTDLATLKEMNEGANAKQYWSPHSFGNAVVIPHSWAIEDGSFLRLQNITLGYTIPRAITRQFACEQFRLYCTLNNVWVWTNYTGYDPEVGTAVRSSSTSAVTPGVDYSSYPKSFSYTFGVNLTF